MFPLQQKVVRGEWFEVVWIIATRGERTTVEYDNNFCENRSQGFQSDQRVWVAKDRFHNLSDTSN